MPDAITAGRRLAIGSGALSQHVVAQTYKNVKSLP